MCSLITLVTNHAADVVPRSTALAFVTKIRNANLHQLKNWQKTISTEDKLDVISRLENVERIVGICRKVRLAYSIRTICDNADRINKSTKSGTKVFV